jgi:hypothetical protein
VRNDSPQRVHLVAIVREAIARKYGPDAGKAWLDQMNTDHWTGDWMPSHEDAIKRAAQVVERSEPRYPKD